MKLQELIQHFFDLFGLRNAIFLESMADRLDLLSISVSDLQDAMRRAPTPIVLQIALARIVSRVFCVADQFRGALPLIEALIEKYPASGCSYCHCLPCVCGDQRPEHTPGTSTDDQYEWTLNQWCRHIEAVYGVKYRQKGTENVLNRLFREVEELRSVSRRVPRQTSSAQEILRAHAQELVDVFTWVMSAANLLEVDLETAVMGRYLEGCTSCLEKPCRCTQFYRAQIDWGALTQNGPVSLRVTSESLPR